MIAKLFVNLQQIRHLADYDYSRRFQKSEVIEKIDLTVAAFAD